MSLFLLALLPSLAYSIEGPSFGARSDANDYAKTAKDHDLKGRVVRRYRDGSGWEYVVRFDAQDEAEARAFAATLTRTLDAPVWLLDDDGKQVDTIAPDPTAQGGGGKAAGKGEPEQDWMEAIIERHGAGRAVFSEAERVKVKFTRELQDGRVAKHVYARRGTDLYLRIEAVKGDVKASETIALGDAAWLVTDGKASSQDLQRARETIERFSLQDLVPMVLDLEELREEHPELARLQKRGTAKVDDDTCEVYASEGEAMIAVGEDGLVRRVAIAGEKRVLEFRKYREVGEVPVPREVRILEDGVLKNTVLIEEIELDGKLDDDWFAPRG